MNCLPGSSPWLHLCILSTVTTFPTMERADFPDDLPMTAEDEATGGGRQLGCDAGALASEHTCVQGFPRGGSPAVT